MFPPSRTRRILKWTGVGLSVLCLATWIVTLWYTLSILWPGNLLIQILDAAVWISWKPPVNSGTSSVFPWRAPQTIQIYGPHFAGSPFQLPSYKHDVGHQVAIPYWICFLLTALPTAWLWHRDRRRIRPGCCIRCGYDLTGNTSGVCPECGEKKAMDTTGSKGGAMSRIVGLEEQNATLSHWDGSYVQLWRYHVSLKRLAIRISQQNRNEDLYIVAGGCESIRGPFSWRGCELRLTTRRVQDGVQTIVSDRKNEFELVSGGVGLFCGPAIVSLEDILNEA